MTAPLAERMRPKRLSDYVGQDALVGPGGILRQQLEQQAMPSMVLWGPPGTGKTTLAELLAAESGRELVSLSAISSGVKDLREVIDRAKPDAGLFESLAPVLFVDEIHRFSKSQQDALLGAVEKGWVTLIGATTENPSFEVIPALLSRCQVYTLESLNRAHLEALLKRAMIEDIELQKKAIELRETEALLRYAGGDARKLLNTFELLIASVNDKKVVVDNVLISRSINTQAARYDKAGEQHYDIISAFIKSIRGSDPNAAVYWLARMIEGGEDVKFIARRLVILAAEDIGNANPTALVVANSTFDAVSVIGNPESRIILSQCATYLAASEKSNASYMAINEAQRLVKKTGDLPVPMHLRNAPSKLMKELGYGEDYRYAHNHRDNFIDQEFLPEGIAGRKLYEPGTSAREQAIRALLKQRWQDKYDY